MSVNVSYKGTVDSYGVSNTMLVENLKEEISKRQNLYKFKLMLGQAELLDQTPVIKYLFTSFTLCYDNKEAAVEINDITLDVTVVKPEAQKVFTEKATPEMTVGQLKQMISRKLTSSQGKWTLKKNGKEIPDGDLLKSHLVSKTLTVNMQDMEVFIKTYVENTSEIHSFKVKGDTTILELKRLFKTKVRMPVDNIGFTFNGQYLDQYEKVESKTEKRQMKKDYEAQTLASFQIMDKSSIIILLKGRGGFN